MRLKFLSALAHRFGALEFRLPGIALQKKRNQFVTAMGFDEVGHRWFPLVSRRCGLPCQLTRTFR